MSAARISVSTFASASMKQAADDGKKRMPKSFYEELDRLTRRSFLVNDDVKTGLAAALEAEFKVEKAPGEADVYIGRVATDLDIVVSGDSDVFCYRNIKTMVRPTRHRGQYVFNVLDKNLALRKMKLGADDLVVLAVVSGNDYASSIPGKAIVTNVKIFQKIKEKGDYSKEEMLKKYLLLCQSDRNFDLANGVFFNCDEGNVLDPLDRSKGLENRDKSETLISEARAALVANSGSRGLQLPQYKRKRWDADKAKRGELDRMLGGIVKMVGESMGHKLSGGKKVIVAIGMGDFSSAKSRHVMFIRGYLEHDERPAYLKPPSKDKNTPMKRKADEGGTSRAGPSKSRKTR
ncbi:hypothetical protein SeLEV6574_g01551 [Synchytrium endobioticum]|uniref:XPG-I domain-containing protein n=1 Tax=Synchytrium endobioticum TaxID=286115 RepID=A0A507DEK6_9FUNG|nr:hypothetical protein SeLEV6574_g01551 [Synchytrium endobioticum]